ncbi:hypothetical protein QJQ45_005134 [Haematococcus lacustris]|nr:hypothetical protein QJQ45_005134 [Haematococcus lacustris]
MAKKKRKGSANPKKGPAKKPKGHKGPGWRSRFQLRAEIHSQLRVIASLFVLRIFLTCLVDYPTPKYHRAPSPPAVQPPKPLMRPPYPHSPRVPWPSRSLPSLPLPACGGTLTLTPSQTVTFSRSQQREQPVRGMMWCPVVAPRKPPQPPRSSQAATLPAASEPGPSTPQPAKRTKAEQAAEPTQPAKAAKATPAPQPGRWVDRDCNAALNIGEAKWRPPELCYWPEQRKLPAKGKEYPELGYKRLRDKPSFKAQQYQQQPAVAQ